MNPLSNPTIIVIGILFFIVSFKSSHAQVCPDFDATTDVVTPPNYDCVNQPNLICDCLPANIDASNVSIPDIPNSTLYGSMVSVNSGAELDKLDGTYLDQNTGQPITITDLSNFVRYYHLMEKDYGFNAFCGNCPWPPYPYFNTPTIPSAVPSNFYEIAVCEDGFEIATPWSCFMNSHPTPNTCGTCPNCSFPPFYADNQVRCATLASEGIDVHASIESIFTKDGACGGNNYGFPSKWFTRDEWGGDLGTIQANAYQWADIYLESYCLDSGGPCAVKKLEVGNEPWGEPGQEAYQAILMGVVNAFCDYFGPDDPQNWPIQLAGPALQAFQDVPRFQCSTCPYPSGDNLLGTIPPSTGLGAFLTSVGVHPYSTLPCDADIGNCDDYDFWLRPEASNSEFQTAMHMAEAINDCDNGFPIASLSVSEFGWNSDDIIHPTNPNYPGDPCNGKLKPGIGRIAQATYIARSIFLASSWGATETIVYEALDSPANKLFYSMGLIETDVTNPYAKTPIEVKPSYHVVSSFKTGVVSSLKFLNAVTANDEGLFLSVLGTNEGEPRYLVAWEGKEIDKSETDFNLNLNDYTIPAGSLQGIVVDGSRPTVLIDGFDSNIYSLGQVVSPTSGTPTQVSASPVPVLIPITSACKYDDYGCLINPSTSDLCASCECPFEIEVIQDNFQCFDDMFTFDLTVKNQVFCSDDTKTWAATINGVTVTGNYNNTITSVGPFPINMGTISYTVNDNYNNVCSSEVDLTPPTCEPCETDLTVPHERIGNITIEDCTLCMTVLFAADCEVINVIFDNGFIIPLTTTSPGWHTTCHTLNNLPDGQYHVIFEVVYCSGNSTFDGNPTPICIEGCDGDPCDVPCDNGNLTPSGGQALISNVSLDECCLQFNSILMNDCESIMVTGVEVCNPANTMTCTLPFDPTNQYECCFDMNGIYIVSWDFITCSQGTFPIGDPVTACVEHCQPMICTPLADNCANVSFEYCCDGTLTSTFTGPVNYVQFINTNTWIPEFICNSWDPALACTGTISTYLDPSEPWAISIGPPAKPGDCDSDLIYIDIDCSPFGPGGDDRQGLKEHTGHGHMISIQPNPANDYIRIINPLERNLSIDVFSTSGQYTLRGFSNGDQRTVINTRGLSQGIYIVQIKDEDSGVVLQIEKLVIVK